MQFSFSSFLHDRILGSPATEAFTDSKVNSYEDLHTDVQSILVPSMNPKGLTVHLLQPISKNFAFTHRLGLESGKPSSNPFMMMLGGGSKKPEVDEFNRPKLYRRYALGGIYTNVLDNGMKIRATSQLDLQLASKSVFLCDVYGNDRLKFQLQVMDDLPTKFLSNIGLTTSIKGIDYVASVRASFNHASGLDTIVSYHQRLNPGSPITLGGELGFVPSRVSARIKETLPSNKPIEWAIGGAYTSPESKLRTSLHIDGSANRYRSGFPTLSLHSFQPINDNSVFVNKFMVDLGTKHSMLASGFKLKFRNTNSTISSMMDSYRTIRTIIERQPLQDLKISLSSIIELKQDGKNEFGFKISYGVSNPIVKPLSPIAISREIFGAS
jgi:hypothetical protein